VLALVLVRERGGELEEPPVDEIAEPAETARAGA